MALNAKRVQLLIDALRSGEYKQGQGMLRPTNNTYCCLGVATDVYKKVTHKGKWVTRKADTYIAFRVGGVGWDAYLPEPVREWYGFEDSDPVLVPQVCQTMVDANDGQGWSFKKIASHLAKLLAAEAKEAAKAAKAMKAVTAKAAR